MTFTPAERTTDMIYDAVIVGGGAAGLFCSVQLAWQGKKVLVAEHMERCGKKLLITGKGRCNVTNNCDVGTVMKNIPRNGKFMYSALYGFSPEDTMAFFEGLGVPLKTERGNRVFPVSDKAADIADALVYTAKQAGVEFVHDNIKSLIIENGSLRGVRGEKNSYCGEKVIIATGGKSYPRTGSTGQGYKLARSAGHTVTEITPSLCPVVTEEKEECAKAMGLSLKNCTLSLRANEDKKPLFCELGEMLFTHFGMSGPLVLSASSYIRDMQSGRYRISIDLKPALSEQQLDKRIQRDFAENQNRDFINAIRNLLPAKMIPVAVRLSGIPADKKANSITKEERHKFAELIKNFNFNIENFRPVEEAIITSGGIPVREINPKTMESRLVSGLFFAGEVIDVDAYTGGFNLQIAFSTAYSAGINM